ncbi:MAG: LPS export ABC transporter periplasmic protein LptC [bacterium]
MCKKARKKGWLRILMVTLIVTSAAQISAFTGSLAASRSVLISGFTLVQEGDAGTWEIAAAEAVYDGETEIVLKQVAARLSGEGKNLITVDGDKGRFFTGKKVLVLEGNVSIQTLSGYSFTAPTLEWNSNESRITVRGGVTLKYRSMILQADRLEHGIESGVFAASGDVNVLWEMAGGPQ